MMEERFRIRLQKERHTFSAAHFITFNKKICERLHGHNYRVAVELAGSLDENHYVVDFIAVRDTLSEIVGELDHHMLLPTQHSTIHVNKQGRELEVTFEDRRWVFPADDCVLLPIANTTAELLARYVGQRLLQSLSDRYQFRPTEISVCVDENDGQWGIWEQ